MAKRKKYLSESTWYKRGVRHANKTIQQSIDMNNGRSVEKWANKVHEIADANMYGYMGKGAKAKNYVAYQRGLATAYGYYAYNGKKMR